MGRKKKRLRLLKKRQKKADATVEDSKVELKEGEKESEKKETFFTKLKKSTKKGTKE